tara:strand:+ start:255 stop:563 length:309 start_codon:yes stop_codon:yes gene_type:complete
MAGYTYITTNKNKTVLYVGATDNIIRRILEHKNKIYKNAFSAKYNCDVLVYYEEFENINDAFLREKQLKSGNRKRKESLINDMNPGWNDLAINWKDENFNLR